MNYVRRQLQHREYSHQQAETITTTAAETSSNDEYRREETIILSKEEIINIKIAKPKIAQKNDSN